VPPTLNLQKDGYLAVTETNTKTNSWLGQCSGTSIWRLSNHLWHPRSTVVRM